MIFHYNVGEIMWKKLENLTSKIYEKARRKKGEHRIALLIDGPNMLRKEFNIDFKSYFSDALKDLKEF